MQTSLEPDISSEKLQLIARVLKISEWLSFWLQLALGAATVLLLIFAISGRSFNQALPPVNIGPAAVGVRQSVTPGIGIGIFWAVAGVVTLLLGLYIAFRLTRFARRLRRVEPSLHPRKADVLQVLRLGVIVGLVGMLLTILGGGATLGLLLAKSIAQPQGVAIYDPTRIIRALDIFVALANMNGIAAHFVGAVTSLGLLRWLHRQ
jgi:Protein of unknown function (DUF3611)